jgi:DNA recombination protein RmuC
MRYATNPGFAASYMALRAHGTWALGVPGVLSHRLFTLGDGDREGVNMTEILLVVLIAAVVIVAVLVVRSSTSTAATDTNDIHDALARMVESQQRLAGSIDTVSKQQAAATNELKDSVTRSQAQLTADLNKRLDTVQEKMGTSLTDSATSTAETLGELSQRLEAIDKAQSNITNLSKQVVSLQHVLDDKHARGAFGEVQLNAIVLDALPASAYDFQAVLSNGKRADCLIRLPNPPGPIAIDAKFPLSAYKEMLNAETDADRALHARQLGVDTKKHINDIADKYILVGETSDSALMFIPSEAVYAELHAHHPGVIELSHKRKVFIVSPTTMMATLTTVRAVLRDVKMREQAGLIQVEVVTMMQDVTRMMERVGKLETHFDLAVRDIDGIRISADKVASRGSKIEALELSDGDDSAAALGPPE